MPWGLKRYLRHRKPAFHHLELLPAQAAAGDRTGAGPGSDGAGLMRERYRFGVVGYVVMPEHLHVLISEPQTANPSTVVQAVKLGFSQRWRATRGVSGQFWQRRFYDFNLWSQRKEVEKLKYMHRNPVVRGLVVKPDEWRWSSYRSYAYGEEGMVRIHDWRWWEEKIRDKTG